MTDTELKQLLAKMLPEKIAEKWAGLILDAGDDEPTEGIKQAILEATTHQREEIERLREELHRQRNICIHHTDAQLVGIVGNCPVCDKSAPELARKENGELLKDKQRLDWLESALNQLNMFCYFVKGGGTIRSAIDHAMTNAK